MLFLKHKKIKNPLFPAKEGIFYFYKNEKLQTRLNHIQRTTCHEPRNLLLVVSVSGGDVSTTVFTLRNPNLYDYHQVINYQKSIPTQQRFLIPV